MVHSGYQKLMKYLAERNQDMIRLTFDEIESVLGSQLPPSAFEHRAWWANSASHSHAKYGWMKAGYETSMVDLDSREVSFVRQQMPAAFASPLHYSKSMGIQSRRRDYSRADLDDIIRRAGGIGNLGAIIDSVQAYMDGDLLETELGRDLRKIWPRR